MNAPASILPSLLIILSLLSLGVHATTYRWVDDSGTVVYSQIPPSDGRPTTVIGAPPPPAESPEATRRRLEAATERLDQSAREREKLKQEQAQKKQEAAQRKKNCEAARKNLETLKSRPPNTLYKVGDDEYRRFTVEELNQKMRDMEKIIEKNCK